MVQLANCSQLLDQLVTSPTAMLSVVADLSQSRDATDASLADAFRATLAAEAIAGPSQLDAGLEFVIHHYTGTVSYNTGGVLEKITGRLIKQIVSTLASAKNSVVSLVFGGEDVAARSAKPKRKSVVRRISVKARRSRLLGSFSRRGSTTVAAPSRVDGSKDSEPPKTTRMSITRSTAIDSTDSPTASFARDTRTTMKQLSRHLADAEPHFIQCIKPNRAGVFAYGLDRVYCGHQLRSCGLLEPAQLQRGGFAFQLSISEFVERYRNLEHPPVPLDAAPSAKVCAGIMVTTGVAHGKVCNCSGVPHFPALFSAPCLEFS
jgi:myosin heavy subunit